MKFRIALDKLSTWLCAVGCVAVCVMMFLMVGDAISRKFIGSIPGGYNTTVGLLVISLFFPQAFAQLKRSHITIDLVTSHLKPRTRTLLKFVSAILGILVFAVITWACGQKAWAATLTKEEWMGIIFYPAWPFRWCLPIGMGLFTLQLIVTAIDEFRDILRRP
jgi:TRAP-type C4-dicarboxylate transport system permease small subunit